MQNEEILVEAKGETRTQGPLPVNTVPISLSCIPFVPIHSLLVAPWEIESRGRESS